MGRTISLKNAHSTPSFRSYVTYINPVKSVRQLTVFEDRHLPTCLRRDRMGWDSRRDEGGPHYVYVVHTCVHARRVGAKRTERVIKVDRPSCSPPSHLFFRARFRARKAPPASFYLDLDWLSTYWGCNPEKASANFFTRLFGECAPICGAPD